MMIVKILTFFLLFFILVLNIKGQQQKKPDAVSFKNPEKNEIGNDFDQPVYGNIFDSDYYSNGALRYSRSKRKTPDRSLTNLRKKLNEEKKRDELMAADAHARMEPNYTGIIKQENIDEDRNAEQQTKLDKIRILHKPQPPYNEQRFYDSSAMDCDFETTCKWTWRRDISHGFFITNGVSLKANETGPRTDANNNNYGSFLLIRLPEAREFHVTSPLFEPSISSCKLTLSVYQDGMAGGEIRVVGDKLSNQANSVNKHTQWVVETISGNSDKQWKKYTKSIGRLSEKFSIILEVVPQISDDFKPGPVVAFDNIQLTQCYAKSDNGTDTTCSSNQYRCKSTSHCINSIRVCDINVDCVEGDDETQNCDLMPYGARCNFEDGWCGWQNVDTKQLEWTLHNGTAPKNYTGPNIDHTYKNQSGHYLFVNMKPEALTASGTKLQSVEFNPPPRVHGNSSSRFYNSCTIRFYIHKTGKHKSAILLQSHEIKPDEEAKTDLLWIHLEDHESQWVRYVLILPNITHKYFLSVTARKGLGYISDVAMDDVSLSPECFGLNIPPEELNGYNYWNPVFNETLKETHVDFINKTIYNIHSCSARGRYGPTERQCEEAYSNTTVKVKVIHEPGMSGAQKWIVPEDGFYTIIAAGAAGGKGSSGMGSSRGAMIRTIAEFRKNQELFILVGQEGTNACLKTLGYRGNSSSCYTNKQDGMTGIRAVLNMDINDSGGGGGGASYVFLRNKARDKIPFVIAAGAGGLGLGHFIDSGMQHGHGINTKREPVTGYMYGEKSSGAGGGWKMFQGIVDSSHKMMMGGSFLSGAIGGQACKNSTDNRGYGGFGGGGGGCRYGGGGGGYSGGDAASSNSTNGEGGYSYLDPKLTQFTTVFEGYNSGMGYVLIIPAIPGCDCDYRCIALDAVRSEVSCICPNNWKLDENKKTCLPLPEVTTGTQFPAWFILILVITICCLVAALIAICCVLYRRYLHGRHQVFGRKMLHGADLQLDRLRGMVSDSMMTEYNPNYEFGGVVYTLKDLKDIPRDQLRLVKALGQGAFGEVYQGFYRQRPCDTVEMPVAVKTLPEMSTSQAEMDFLMEALIMSKFNHPNIVHFIGVCFDKHPRFIVLELLCGGDLKNFLRESRPKPERGSSLSMKDLVLIAVDIAKGCKYLEDNRFIHRDIAARNCLLTTKGPGRCVKIADFGMSRDVYRSDYYRKGGKAMLPIKWMPPEAFLDGIFTSKTDVWSFGVLLWEIMSMGYMPYTGCANREVMQLVTSGGRLEPPVNCPGPIYGIMSQCWHPNPDERPTFATILERLGYCTQDPQVMNAPLPVFLRPPSNERDTTVMRPANTNETCLQVVPNSDYLIPNHTTPPGNPMESSSSVEKLLPDSDWETSFIMPSSRSTQPLLMETGKDEETAINVDKLLTIDNNPANPKVSPISLPNHILGNHNNNIKSEPSLKSGVSLDAGALVKQSMNPNQKKYANINAGDSHTGNGLLPNGPFPTANQNKYIGANNSKFLSNEAEINC